MALGVIALDIDGTITDRHHEVDGCVVAFLHQLVDEGWRVVFVTGRTLARSEAIFSHITFPSFAILYNGAITVRLPHCHIVDTRYLSKTLIPPLGKITRGEGTDFVLYMGVESGDVIYYRKEFFLSEPLSHLLKRAEVLGEDWRQCDDFMALPNGKIASFKCFSSFDVAKRLGEEIVGKMGLHAPLVRDPYDERHAVVQVTQPEATKGLALRHLIDSQMLEGPIIVAGDDFNDIDMLKEGQERIVMATAPQEVLQWATVVAPSAKELGIITGLKEAIQRIEHGKDHS